MKGGLIETNGVCERCGGPTLMTTGPAVKNGSHYKKFCSGTCRYAASSERGRKAFRLMEMLEAQS